jgi:hypothetical protein
MKKKAPTLLEVAETILTYIGLTEEPKGFFKVRKTDVSALFEAVAKEKANFKIGPDAAARLDALGRLDSGNATEEDRAVLGIPPAPEEVKPLP